MVRKLFTSESVTEGHPDKLADQISDSVLDSLLAADPNSRVACETALTTGLALIMGEISTSVYVDIPKIARQTALEIGYDRPECGFDGHTCAVITAIDEQSADISLGVNKALEQKEGLAPAAKEELGAGDQGMMFGYATNETEAYMPLTISLAHTLCRRLSEARRQGRLPFLRPDGKAQVTVEYENGRPVRLDTVLISAQHDDQVAMEVLRQAIIEQVVRPALPGDMLDDKTRFLVNPTGRFVIGGPLGDSGLTGRKIIVDTYGGMARHGGGCFSGKDPTKVDRSAAYAARYAAKNVVAAGLAAKCELQLAYAIGVARPVSLMVDTFGTNQVDEEEIVKALGEIFDFTPSGIIRDLDLRRPIYRQTAAYGHFGRQDLDLPWERLDKTAELKRYFKL
ncbi:MAG: methionine adenosyltransferase [Peptococcaceae bacterium]|jgi:S-adenosylmethionine synthetase|nr:methionine adenosyltransferase [Peptococcaceae bacterium]